RTVLGSRGRQTTGNPLIGCRQTIRLFAERRELLYQADDRDQDAFQSEHRSQGDELPQRDKSAAVTHAALQQFFLQRLRHGSAPAVDLKLGVNISEVRVN